MIFPFFLLREDDFKPDWHRFKGSAADWRTRRLLRCARQPIQQQTSGSLLTLEAPSKEPRRAPRRLQPRTRNHTVPLLKLRWSGEPRETFACHGNKQNQIQKPFCYGSFCTAGLRGPGGAEGSGPCRCSKLWLYVKSWFPVGDHSWFSFP